MPTSPRSEDLESIPGVGKSIAADLRRLGFPTVSALRTADPERMYQRLCAITGTRQDPCVLYVFRCAVYFASRRRHQRELLKWWNWKGRRLERSR